jgi:glycosyltransferase involved in cell wall biosynthesis
LGPRTRSPNLESMGKHGTVAVIIPTLNRRDLVVQAVMSVMEQNYADVRCIVVDNGSTDGTGEAVKALENPRVSLLAFGARTGAAAARNAGIDAAAGASWVAFLDSDDLWAPAKLESQLAAISRDGQARWSATACVHVGADLKVRNANRLRPGPLLAPEGSVIGSQELLGLLKESNRVPGGGSSVLVSRELALEVGGFSIDVAASEDWELWLRLAKRSPIAYVDRPLVAWRIWEGQTSGDEKAQLSGATLLRRRHFPDSAPLPPKYLARWQREAARRHVAAGNRVPAARNYVRAAWAGRDPGQLAYATAALVSPSLTEKRLRRIERSRGLPEGWEAEVEQWLARWRNQRYVNFPV